MHYSILAPPSKVGKTKRAMSAHVTVIEWNGAREIACTVPKRTLVHFVRDGWYMAGLAWLEKCESDRLRALGAAPGRGRTSLTYHNATRHGIRIDEADVTGVMSVAF